MFQDHADNPILQASDAGWDEKGATFASVVRVDGYWYMFYSGRCFPHAIGWKIGAAVSKDGVKWFKHGKPVLKGTKYLWDQDSVHAPVIWREDGKYRMLYTGVGTSIKVHYIGCAESIDGVSWSKRYSPCFRDPRLHDSEAWCLLPRKDDYVLLYNTLIQLPREVYVASTKNFESWTMAEAPLLPSTGDEDDLGYFKYCANMVVHNGWYYIAAAMSNSTYNKNAIGLWRTKTLDVHPEYLGVIIQRDQPWKAGEVDTPWIVPMSGNRMRIYYSGRVYSLQFKEDEEDTYRVWKLGLAEGTFE